MADETPAPLSPEMMAMLKAAAEASTSAMFIGAAIVGALVERGTIDPLKVAAWADVLAKGNAENPGVVAALEGFATLIRAMATVPAGAGRA